MLLQAVGGRFHTPAERGKRRRFTTAAPFILRRRAVCGCALLTMRRVKTGNFESNAGRRPQVITEIGAQAALGSTHYWLQFSQYVACGCVDPAIDPFCIVRNSG
jgi:hypothetical protein